MKRLEREIETSEREKSTSRHLNDTRQQEKENLSKDIETLQQKKKEEEQKVKNLRTWQRAMIEEKRAAAGNPWPSTGRHERNETDPDLQDSRGTKQPKNEL